jgi:hypothetical protein
MRVDNAVGRVARPGGNMSYILPQTYEGSAPIDTGVLAPWSGAVMLNPAPSKTAELPERPQ